LYRRLYGLTYVVLRYPNVYGPRQNPHGEAGVNAIFIGLMLEGKTPVIFGDGEQVRDYVYVSDIVEANRQALHRGDNDAFHIGSGRGTSVNDLYRELSAILEWSRPAVFSAARSGEIRRVYLNAQKAERVLGWRPTVPLSEGLRRTVEWHRRLRQAP
jgi:UDP-glucose 4-epimerase